MSGGCVGSTGSRLLIAIMLAATTLAGCAGWDRDPIKSMFVLGLTWPVWLPVQMAKSEIRRLQLPPPSFEEFASVRYLGSVAAPYPVARAYHTQDGQLRLVAVASRERPDQDVAAPDLRVCAPGQYRSTVFREPNTRNGVSQRARNGTGITIVAEWSNPHALRLSLWRTDAARELALPVAERSKVPTIGNLDFLICSEPGRFLLLIGDAIQPAALDVMEIVLLPRSTEREITAEATPP